MRVVDMLTWNEYEEQLNNSNYTVNIVERTPFDGTKAALFACYSLLFVVGVAGNAWVSRVIWRLIVSPYRGETPVGIQIYILALCCCDLVVLGFSVFLLLDMPYGWIIPSRFLCLLYLGSESLNKFYGPFVLTAMSCYCFFSVLCSHSNYRSAGSGGFGASSKLAVVVVVALVPVVLALISPVFIYSDIVYFVVYNDNVITDVLPKCAFLPPEELISIFLIYTFLLGFVAPAALFTFFYSAILYLVRERRCVGSGGDSSMQFWRVAKNCMVLVGFYLACWGPYSAMNFYNYCYPQSAVQSGQEPVAWTFMSYFIHMLPYINCTGYPIIYTLLNRNIKAAYQRVKANQKQRRDGGRLSNGLKSHERSSATRLSNCPMPSPRHQSVQQ